LLLIWTHRQTLGYDNIYNIDSIAHTPSSSTEDSTIVSNGTAFIGYVNMNQNDLGTTISTIYRHRNITNSSIHKCGIRKINVSFLKVHKAGSTTVMNIFLRFAIQHNLNIVLPRNSKGNLFNYLGFGKTLSKKRIVPLPTNESYNILCNHVVYNKTAFRSILQDDTVYVGIVRDPVSHFKSAALYYAFFRNLRKLANEIPSENVVSEFLKDPSKWGVMTHFVHNRMCYDFGIPKHEFNNDTFIERYINDLSQDYSIMLILEYLPESLVLMKRKLCWSIKDILYVPLNALKKQLNFELNNDDIELLKQWNSADFKLYEHFVRQLKERIGSIGHDFDQEVEYFKSVQKQVQTFCKETISNKSNTSVIFIPKSNWEDKFMVTNTDCAFMMELEKPMMKRLIENAWSRYNASLTHER
jgi:hypothetical protein